MSSPIYIYDNIITLHVGSLQIKLWRTGRKGRMRGEGKSEEKRKKGEKRGERKRRGKQGRREEGRW